MATTAQRTKPADPKVRNGLLAKVHIAKKQLGLQDAEYRATLSEHFNVESAKHLTIPQLSQLLNHFISKGWQPGKVKQSSNKQSGWIDIPATVIHYRQKRKICALGKMLGWDLNGLNTRVSKQFRVDKLIWLKSQAHLQTLMSDLVNRCYRAGIDPYPERKQQKQA